MHCVYVCGCLHVCGFINVFCLFIVYMWTSKWVFTSLALQFSLLYLSILWAGADRADVDNYKVFAQRANFGDVCLPLSLFLSHRSFFFSTPSSFSCGSVASQRTTAPQTQSTIFKYTVCVGLWVCVFVFFFFLFLLFLSVDCSSVDTYLLAILLFNSIWTQSHAELPSSLLPHSHIPVV